MGNQRSVLRNANPNVGDDPDIMITEVLLLREGRRKEAYRGTLSEPVEGKPFVVCKVAYGQNAMAVLKREAELYQGKLKQLQGVRVPTCFGYFIGDKDEGLTGCLALDYCGEPVETCFEDLDLEFEPRRTLYVLTLFQG